MLRAGVIGVGSMGQNHARIYHENANLVGVADLDKEAVKKVGKRYNTKYYTDYKKLLKNVDVVSIAVPTGLHYKVSMDAINAGKHVLIEKPICNNIRDGEKLIQRADEQGVVLAVGHVERHNPIVRFAKEALKKKRFGDVISIAARRVSSFPSRIKDVGVILDIGIHDIDVIRYLADSEIKTVYALAGSTGNAKFDDHANVLLSFNNNISGFVEVNWLTPMKVRTLSLTCSKNFVELDYMKQSVKISSSKLVEYNVKDLFKTSFEFDVREISLKKEEPLRNEIYDFMNAIKKKRKPLVTGNDGLKALQIALAAERSYKDGKQISMEG
ncbi:MAG: Gfo/Idh/MocA family oxidoreductase [Candidatus Thermoplasmatota archaeon]|nr:Gfo/Idh/MocA family oxidoreductase [Candidatus Thermoplasmatota archaeon]MBU4256056.1 Gfo/Idh/MocA family oxidoreductase [Candidatus Thermoplasmatota archaeon]MCG2825197.1 Gfo/Idh/MocA family oxidoreductase [Thermoplasmatales archaeon]